ncbi:MAG: hypothetical protein ABIN80_24075 [Dyadobacter sp.]|uniref:hypothetical protein n=1 Tax=Dyadobacter sp. TaxID=1914288 RepID=UPI00326572B9
MKYKINAAVLCGLAIGLLGWSCSHEKEEPIVVKPEPQKLRIEKITSGTESAQAYAYNAQGLIVRFTSHWVYPNSTSDANAVIEYDSLSRVSKITDNGSNAILFFYRGNILDKTEEHDHRNRLSVSHFYLFSNEGRLLEVLDQVHDADSSTKDYFIKNRYEYDQNSNVMLVKSSISRAVGEKFAEWLEVRYEEYDTKLNPDPGFINYPFVGGKSMRLNNAGKITVRDMKTQSIVSVQHNSYTYNSQGYPIRKVQELSSAGARTKTTLDYHYSEYQKK